MPSGTLSQPYRGKLQPRLLQDCSSWDLTQTQKEDWGKNRRGRREKQTNETGRIKRKEEKREGEEMGQIWNNIWYT